MVNPVSLGCPLILPWFLIHYPAQLARLLFLLAEIHGLRVYILHDVGVLCRQGHDYLLVFLSAAGLSRTIRIDGLFVPQQFGVVPGDCKYIPDHVAVCVVIIVQAKTILRPGLARNVKAI